MTFKHKLSRRLAQNGPLLLGALLAFPACTSDPTGSQYDVSAIRVSPRSVVLPPNGSQRFTAIAEGGPADGLPVPVTWSAEGGTIDGDGRFVAGANDGTYRVYATHASLLWLTDSSTAVVSASAVLNGLRIYPREVTVTVDQTAEFTAYLLYSTGDSAEAVEASWSADSGTVERVNGRGRYKNGNPGRFKVRAQADAFQDSVTVIVEDTGGVAVASVVVAPESASLTVGGTLQLSAVARDAAGNTLSGRSFTWASTNGAVASVSGAGMVTGLATGTAGITVTSEGRADTATIMVAAPPPPGNDPTPWYELSFESYGSTAELLADKGAGATFTNEDNTPSKIELVNDAPAGLGLTRSMRYMYDNPNPDGVVTVGRNVNLPSPAGEIWVEVYLKWSANFDTRGGTAPYDHKVLFGRYLPEVGRWELKVGQDNGANVGVGWPGDRVVVQGLNSYRDLWDGNWKRLRFHWKLGTGNADGVCQMWLGDVLVYSNTSVTVASAATGRIYGLALGRNQDNRNVSDLPMYLTWGRTRVWNTDPAW